MKPNPERHYRRRTPSGASEALGQSEVFLEFQERLSRVAPVNRPVLLLGERGTGKELAANRLHYLSKRWQGAFLTLNCSALSSSLIESELFGFEKGAFTGAAQRRIGRFEAADNGTLFLDEIGNIPMEVQEKILRVVEYNAFERVGSSESIEVDVRIIAATNADVKALAARNMFKEDLLDRLSFEVLVVPPLRERGEDILLLAKYFAGHMAIELEREEIPQFSPQAVRALEVHQWPGNVRELKNVVERAVYRSQSTTISEVEFDPFSSPYQKKPPEMATDDANQEKNSAGTGDLMGRPLKTAVRDLKVLMLENALQQAKFNQKKAAQILGLTYHQFRGLYRQYRKNED
ncbi:Psp operon transcriptional activator [Olavius sp. associated proteobacterium Delta 1]|nr:Psp operon transcriptional activator [Olavius sp. associated proteobacterium Delta 1]